jgi:hypothetical protein
MSDRPLAITQRQVRAICNGARKAGYAPVFEVGNIRIRLLPEEHLARLSEPDEKTKKDENFRL